MIPTRSVGRHDVPTFMYGTAWKEERTAALVTQALAVGFRAIDTANQRKHYNELGVGDALRRAWRDGSLTRDQCFLQSKFTYRRGQDHRLPYDPDAPSETQVRQSFASSLDHLDTGYLDSYVLHGPELDRGLTETDREVWRTMESLVDEGSVRLLGISNVSRAQLEELVAWARVRPSFVQNRCYARTGWDREVRKVCDSIGAVYQGFSLLTANARELDRREVRAIATRLDRTVEQLVFRFAVEVGMLPLTGSSDRKHLEEDAGVFDFALDAQDRAVIEHLALA